MERTLRCLRLMTSHQKRGLGALGLAMTCFAATGTAQDNASDVEAGPSAHLSVVERGAPSAHPEGEDIVISTTLSGRHVELRMDSYAFRNAQSGNGAIAAVDVVPIGGGSIVLVHHNLDFVVDPPRFDRSRWSELWWFPPSFQSGQRPEAVALGGRLHWSAHSPVERTLCLSNAAGETTRFETHGETLNRHAGAGACRARLARQRDWYWEVTVDTQGSLVSEVAGTPQRWAGHDDYLQHQQVRSLRLGPQLEVFAVNAFWSDDGQYLPGETVPQIRSTRLVIFDARSGELIVRWFYASFGHYCRARLRGDELVCGRRFRVREDGAVEVVAPR